MNPTATNSPTAAMMMGHGKRVLVVDDDQGVLSMTSAILQAAGYIAETALSGEQGLEAYSKSLQENATMDIVLLDLTLPGGISGMETLDRLLKLDPHAHVIATSGYFEESAAAGATQAAKQRGFQGILPKPYTTERLLRLLQVSLSEVAA